ncbi:MAG: translation initiation factor IF-2 [Myxococcota bacterium]
MSKIRAYKLAEELGIDRNEFVAKAAELGFELKSAMAALEPDVVEKLREQIGGEKRKPVVEERVESSGGTAVIRRRRRKVVEPEPEPEPQPEPEPAEPVAAEPEPEPEPEVAPESEPEAEEPEAPEIEPVVEPVTPQPAAAAAKPAPSEAPRTDAGGTQDRKGRARKRVREVVNLREQEQFARQVTGRNAPRRVQTVDPRTLQSPRRRRRDTPAKPAVATAPPKEQKRVVRVEGEISVGELAKQLGIKAPQVQGKLMALGTMVSVNQKVDVETARRVASDLGFEVQDVGFKEEEFLEAPAIAADDSSEAAELVSRPPIITVMGHVDHGKTSLLDAIRNANVVEGEAGGITQHIGAYQARSGDAVLTFIDTPGHAAFTAMRARGAQVTDLVILVVAATDGVMPQTIEAIEHAQAAGVPIVVAVNKCDLPEADPQRTRQRLMEHNLVPEEFGGDIICVDVSAVKGTGLDQLLEMVSLQAEVLELKADPARRAKGVVLEAQLDKGRGPVATVLVQDGTLQRGDVIVAGSHWGKVRLMENDHGERVKEAGPSVPVAVIGLSGVPDAGVAVHAVESEKIAKQIVAHREEVERGKPVEVKPKLTLEEIFAQAEEGGVKELPVVLKADVHGTLEAVRESLTKLSTDRVTLNVIAAGVGGITENDVMLASASEAIVVGFHVRPDPAARRAADSNGVEIRVYQIIMDLLDEVKAAMAGLLPPTIKEVMLGRVEVRETFTIPRVGTICGSYVTEGLVRRNARCRLIRDGVQIYEGRVGSLKRFKDDAREVQTGFECGVGIEGYNDVKVGDAIEIFELEEQPATL